MQSDKDCVSRTPSMTMTESNEFGEKVVLILNFPDDNTVFDEEFEKSTLCVNHSVKKYSIEQLLLTVTANMVVKYFDDIFGRQTSIQG